MNRRLKIAGLIGITMLFAGCGSISKEYVNSESEEEHYFDQGKHFCYTHTEGKECCETHKDGTLFSVDF